MGQNAASTTISGDHVWQVFDVNGPEVTISGLTITAGSSLGDAGGINHAGGILTIAGCVISGNSSFGNGGGVFSSGTSLNIRDSVIASNGEPGSGQGGGVYLATGTLLLERCHLSSNNAENGAGLFVAFGATATLVDSTISQNTASSAGAGLNNAGDSTLVQCTVALNSASLGGGCFNQGMLSVNQCTMANNVGSGAGIYNNSGSLQLGGTILANSPQGNFSGTGGLSLGYNLSDDASAAPFLIAPGDQNNVTSAGTYLGSLQNNGGPTPTIALLTGSSAINAGGPGFTCALPPCYDQRGTGSPRVQGGRIDIGAFESTPPNHPPTVLCPNPVTVDTAAAAGTSVQLIASVTDADGNPLTVTWTVDNGAALPSTGGTASSPSFTRVYATGNHTVAVTVSDGIAAPVSCSTTVTVLAPRAAKAAVRASLFALRNSTPNDRSKFDSAISYLDKSIDIKNWVDDSHPKPGAAGESIFNNEKSAVSGMQGIQSKYPTLTAMINRLVKVDRSLAVISIEYAVAHNGNAAKISTAQTYLTKGDTDTTAGKPTYAIDDYKNAWKSAVAAAP